MKVRTKSGFECNVNERRLKDWRYVKAAAKMNEGDEAGIASALTFAIPFLLGEDGEAALMKHVEDEDGVVDSEKFVAEYVEITQAVRDKAKKSQSSSSS